MSKKLTANEKLLLEIVEFRTRLLGLKVTAVDLISFAHLCMYTEAKGTAVKTLESLLKDGLLTMDDDGCIQMS
jgi:hypothetical protein